MCHYLFGVKTQTELDAWKRKNEKTEKELRASRTRAQELATKNEEMAVSYSTFITITHVTWCYIYESVKGEYSIRIAC